LPVCVTFGLVAAGAIIGTCAACATGAASSERPDETSPINATTLSREMSFFAAVALSPGLLWLSSKMSSSLRSSTPPAALMSSMASTTPWWEVWPQSASLPVSEVYSPTLMGSCACATAANAARARRRLGVFMAKWAWRSGVDVLHEREAAVLHRRSEEHTSELQSRQ